MINYKLGLYVNFNNNIDKFILVLKNINSQYYDYSLKFIHHTALHKLTILSFYDRSFFNLKSTEYNSVLCLNLFNLVNYFPPPPTPP